MGIDLNHLKDISRRFLIYFELYKDLCKALLLDYFSEILIVIDR